MAHQILAKNIILIITLGLFFFLPRYVLSEESKANEIGRKIAQLSVEKNTGWKTEQSKLKMILKNSHGEESIRELRRTALEVNEPGLGDKSLTVFDNPKDIEGTAFLSHTKILEADDQWLYLPALKRVKRISSANKSGSFVGSEFSYEDLLSPEVEKYSHKFVAKEKCPFMPGLCYKVEQIPLYKYSGYTKFNVWYDANEYRIDKVQYFDKKNTALKTLEYKGYKLYNNKFWRASSMEMKNIQTEKSTTLTFEEWKLGEELSENDFEPNRLKNIR